MLATVFGAAVGVVPLTFYTFGVFVGPLSQAFGWSRAEITAAPLFVTLGSLIAGVFAGALADRFGARRVVLWSQALLALAFAAFTLLPASLPLFYLGYVLLAIVGAGTLTMTWARAIVGWFVSGRGLALGLSLVGTGLLGAVLPAYISTLAEMGGWRAAYLGLAALPLVLGLPLTYLFFREPPENEAALSQIGAPETLAGSYTFSEALRTRCFWQMTLAFTIVALPVSAVVVHSVPLLTDRGVHAATAAALVGLIGVSLTSGRLVSGFLLDRLPGPLVAGAMFALPALSCVLLVLAAGDLWLCGLAIVVVGLAAGAEHDIAGYFCAKYFGRRHYGKIFGLLYTLYGLGSGVGPLLAGKAVDRTGDYDGALYVGAVLFAISAALIVGLRPPSPAHRVKTGDIGRAAY